MGRLERSSGGEEPEKLEETQEVEEITEPWYGRILRAGIGDFRTREEYVRDERAVYGAARLMYAHSPKDPPIIETAERQAAESLLESVLNRVIQISDETEVEVSNTMQRTEVWSHGRGAIFCVECTYQEEKEFRARSVNINGVTDVAGQPVAIVSVRAASSAPKENYDWSKEYNILRMPDGNFETHGLIRSNVGDKQLKYWLPGTEEIAELARLLDVIDLTPEDPKS
jgi:hypothetical protein